MKRLLIVEDEEILRTAYEMIFIQEGYDVQCASNGQEALQIVPTFKPHVIVLDILMPVMNGIQFLECAKLSKHMPQTRVLVLSNLSDKETIEHVYALGATEHVIKSNLSPGQLVKKVQQLLSGKH